MAVVSGNFTLMSAGYFLSPEAGNHPQKMLCFFMFPHILVSQTFIRWQWDERDEFREDALPDHGAGNEAGVVSGILGFHFGDVEIPGLLGDEAPAVGVQENGKLVEDPTVGDLLCGAKDTRERGRPRQQGERLIYSPGHALGGTHSRTAPCPSLTCTGSLST